MVEISIIIPTKNNADILEKCLKSIQNLDYPKEKLEVIIVDGHSTDGTVDIAKKYGCKIIFENKGTISYARDVGVKHAKGRFIAFTDADCVVDKNWIKELVKHFKSEKIAAVGGPNITPEDDTDFAKCVGIVLEFLSKLGSRYGLTGGEVREIYHNPTCNVMYRKKVLQEVGGFNHDLVTVDDEELDYRIRKLGYKILYTPYAIVYHYRKPTWKKFIKMAYTYGMGRMQAIKLHSDMGKWFHFAPSVLIISVLFMMILSILKQIFFWLALGIIAIGVVSVILISINLSIKHSKNFLTICCLIVIWFLFWSFGFIRGVFK